MMWGDPTNRDGKVGTRPGGIKESLDIATAKLDNGHDLAIFGAG